MEIKKYIYIFTLCIAQTTPMTIVALTFRDHRTLKLIFDLNNTTKMLLLFIQVLGTYSLKALCQTIYFTKLCQKCIFRI